jgi:hypothetical protein
MGAFMFWQWDTSHAEDALQEQINSLPTGRNDESAVNCVLDHSSSALA